MDVHIIGQPRIGADWALVIPVTCGCGTPFMIYGQVQATRACPRCGRIHRLMAMPTFDAATGSVRWPIGVLSGPTKEETRGKDE